MRRPNVEAAIEAALTREIIEIDAVQARVLPDRVVYIKLRSFQETTGMELRRALDHAVEQTAGKGGVAGVMLDMRNNPGGLLSSAVLVADEFLEDGVIVSTRGRGGRLLREHRASESGTRPNWPMVVLVDGFSASAAEIVAGALHDHRRAILVGTRTFGKGSVQNVIELPDDSAMKLTTALYYTPSGISIQARGIEPDVTIERSDAVAPNTAAGEAMLEGHLGPDARSGAQSGDRSARGIERATVRDGRSPFADDAQARMAHEVLRALITSK
jgi:carboxyl-terminal processing protease